MKSGPVPWVPGAGFRWRLSGEAQPVTPRGASSQFFSRLSDTRAIAFF